MNRKASHSNHYNQPQLLESIFAKLNKLGLDQEQITRRDIAALDEFHLQGAAVSKELAEKLNLSDGQMLLDVGCGIGGPSRMLADEFGCNVIGIDYTSEYIKTAKALTQLIGLNDQVSFLQANALQIPFEEATFDVVWTQHVQMNIADKARFYSEIQRVMKTGGKFVYYDIFDAKQGDVHFPLPWAEDSTNNFLLPHRSVTDYFDTSQFQLIFKEDHTQRATSALTVLVEKIQSGTAPPLGLNLLMGESTQQKFTNLLRALSEGKVEVHAGIYSKR